MGLTTVQRDCAACDYVEMRLRIISERELKFRFAIVIVRPSVVCLSSVCLSVTLVHPTQAIEIFGDVSTPYGTLAIRDLCIKILRRLSQGNSFVGVPNSVTLDDHERHNSPNCSVIS